MEVYPRIHKAKHGSDTNAYTRKGLFDDENFEEVFRTYSEPPNFDTLTWKQARRLARGNRDPFDVFGSVANFLEWLAVYLLLWPADGKMRKEDIRGIYDGSFFIATRQRRSYKKKYY